MRAQPIELSHGPARAARAARLFAQRKVAFIAPAMASDLRRGVRNVIRNRTRTLLVTLILGVSIGAFLTLTQVGAQTEMEARQLRQDAYTLIQVNPVGQSGIVGPRSGLPESLGIRIGQIPNVVKVESYLRRQFQDNSKPLQFQMGAIMGVEPRATLRLTSMGSQFNAPAITAGRSLVPSDRGKAVAVVGRVFAEQNGLDVGSSFTFPAELLRGRGVGRLAGRVRDLRAVVVGIYATGVTFGDNQLFIPLDVLQRALGRPGEVSQFWVRVDQADSVPQVERALKTLLLMPVDVLSFGPQASVVAQSLEAVRGSTVLARGIALVFGVIVVLLTMVLITRERRREIGVLKAIGASNGDVARQFVAESIALALLGGAAGLILYTVGGPTVGTVMVAQAGQRMPVAAAFSVPVLANALIVALVFGVLGSVYPVRQALRMSPVEAIRSF